MIEYTSSSSIVMENVVKINCHIILYSCSGALNKYLTLKLTNVNSWLTYDLV